MSTISPADKTPFNRGRGFGFQPSPQKPEEKKAPSKPRIRFKMKNPFGFLKRAPHPRLTRKKAITLSAVIVVLLAGGGALGYYEYIQQNDPKVIFAKKLKNLTQQISQYVAVPKDESPVTATVTDTTKLPNEAFFNQAQNGDKIILYKKNKIAILYRPSTGKVITEATLDFRNVTPTPEQSSAVAGASTSASTASVSSPPVPNVTVAYHPQGKILVQPE